MIYFNTVYQTPACHLINTANSYQTFNALGMAKQTVDVEVVW